MSEQTISFETTTVTAEKTAGEIEDMLRKADVSKVGKSFESGQIKAIYFQMDTPDGSLPFRLPVNVGAVYQILLLKRESSPTYRYNDVPADMKQKIHQQAERTAWRIIHWWLKGQLALVQTQMVTVTEIFLPYMLVSESETFYQRLKAGDFKALMPPQASDA